MGTPPTTHPINAPKLEYDGEFDAYSDQYACLSRVRLHDHDVMHEYVRHAYLSRSESSVSTTKTLFA